MEAPQYRAFLCRELTAQVARLESDSHMFLIGKFVTSCIKRPPGKLELAAATRTRRLGMSDICDSAAQLYRSRYCHVLQHGRHAIIIIQLWLLMGSSVSSGHFSMQPVTAGHI
jgi:hypothetical protein